MLNDISMRKLSAEIKFQTGIAVHIGVDRLDLHQPKLAATQGKLDSAALRLTAAKLRAVTGLAGPCRADGLALLKISDAIHDLDGC